MPTLESLLTRRLLIVTGKGGTGKTTLAAALGVLAARRGIDCVVAEMGNDTVLPRLLSDAPPPRERDPGREPVKLAPNLFSLHIDPRVALTEYLELQLRVRRLARAIVGNHAFDRFLDAAPGWRELITLGKLWYLTSQEEAGRPRWPLVIVDAPATGHGLSFLSVPNVIVETVRLGPLRRHTEQVLGLLRDPERTLVVPVTLPEELPVNETLELRERVRELGLGLGPLIANAVETAPDLPEVEAVLRMIAALSADDAPALARPSSLHEAVQHRVMRSRMHRGFLERLRTHAGTTIELPYLAQSLDRPKGIDALATCLEAAL